MPEPDDRSLIPLPDGSLANTAAGAKRILAEMVGKTLAVMRREDGAATPEPESFDLPLPEAAADKLFAMSKKMHAAGIDTPEKLAATLLAQIGPKAKPFTQAIAGMVAARVPALAGKHDWSAIYAGLAKPEQEAEPDWQSIYATLDAEKGSAGIGGVEHGPFKIGACAFCEPDYRQILIWAKALAFEPEEVVQRLLEGGTVMVNDCIGLDGPQAPCIEKWMDEVLTFASALIREGKKTSKDIWDSFEMEFGKYAEYHLKLFLWQLGKAAPAVRCAIDWDALYAQVLYRRYEAEFIADGKGCDPLKIRELRWRFDLLPISNFEWVKGLDVWVCAKFSERYGRRVLIETLSPQLRDVTRLECCNLGLKELDLSGVPRLEKLRCDGNEIETLDIRPLTRLKTLRYDADSTRLIQGPGQNF